MTLSLLALATIVVTVTATSFISGIFGMAGGLILLGVLLVFLDVPSAQMLFGVTQLGSNGWRGYLWRAHVRWDIVRGYVAGSVVAFLAMRLVAFVPDKATMYVGLGALPFLARFVPRRLDPDITRPFAPAICGGSIMIVQLLAGAAGNILDIFFQRSPLDRKQIVATKAATQVVAHVLRILYFGSLADLSAIHLPWWIFPLAVGLAMTGASLAAGVLHRMSDVNFRLWSQRIILTVSGSYLLRGLYLIATR